MDDDDLTSTDLLVLEALTRARVWVSVIHLATEVWQAVQDELSADLVGMVTYVLQNLNERGLVTYRVLSHIGQRSEPDFYTGLPFTIHLTKEGWARAGYATYKTEVGRKTMDSLPKRPGDATDYRIHREHVSSTACGPIERMPFWDHMRAYPDHLFHFDSFEDGEPNW